MLYTPNQTINMIVGIEKRKFKERKKEVSKIRRNNYGMEL